MHRLDGRGCGEFETARILLAKYFFNRSVPTDTVYTGTSLEWKWERIKVPWEIGDKEEGLRGVCPAGHAPRPGRPARPAEQGAANRLGQQGLLPQLCQAPFKKTKTKTKHLKPPWQYSWECEAPRVKKARSWGFCCFPFAVFPVQTRPRDTAGGPQSNPICFTRCSLHLKGFFYKHRWQHFPLWF